MYNGDKETALLKYVREAMPKAPRPEPESVQREAERQAAIQERSEKVQAWREFANSQDRILEGELDGARFKSRREACGLDIGIVSEVAGVSPSTIQDAESGKRTFADSELRRVNTAMRDALR